MSTKDYVLTCYDKEIYYYTHAPTSDIDFDLFVDTSLQNFIHQLRAKREQLVTIFVAADEPFVLVHNFNGQNIMMQGSKVRAVLDWEFSGVYPLSELIRAQFGGIGIDVLEVIDEDSGGNFKVESKDYGHGRRNGEAEAWDGKECRDAGWRWGSRRCTCKMEMFPT